MTAEESLEDWCLIESEPDVRKVGALAKANPLPLPSSLSRPRVPRFQAPFQVSSESTPKQPHSQHRPAKPQMPAVGLQQPDQTMHTVSSLSHQFHRIHSIQSYPESGLPAPQFQHPPPGSIVAPASVDGDDLHDHTQHALDAVPSFSSELKAGPSGTTSKQSQETFLSRVRLAANSGIVIQLWMRFTVCFTPFSETLQQMQ